MKQAKWPRALHAFGTAVVIAGGAFLWHNLPTPDDVYGPFDVHAGLGQKAVGRAISVEVSGARIAPRLRQALGSNPELDAVGTWVAVDAEAVALRSDDVANVELSVGPNTYVPTMRTRVTPMVGALAPGIAVRGPWVFDVPADLMASTRQMTLRVWVRDGRMDSRLVIDIPLDDQRVSRSDLLVMEPDRLAGT